jgi:hypothetical protein
MNNFSEKNPTLLNNRTVGFVERPAQIHRAICKPVGADHLSGFSVFCFLHAIVL